MDPVPAARALVAERFPDALYAFLGGSALTGRRTSRSDLDVVVVLDGLAVPYRESLRWREWPVDLMAHNELSLIAYADRDLAGRRPTLPRVCGEGVVLTDRAGRAAEVQAAMRERLSAGPGPAAPGMLDRARYVLSDLLDDLAGATDPGEQAFVRWQIVQESARLALTAAGRWHGSGKWLLRELRSYDAALADELLSAHDDPVRLAATATSVLERAGGRLWEGYRADGDPVPPTAASPHLRRSDVRDRPELRHAPPGGRQRAYGRVRQAVDGPDPRRPLHALGGSPSRGVGDGHLRGQRHAVVRVPGPRQRGRDPAGHQAG
ncbi:nucleotidyltransferase domain-containing protein [Nonomuraea sp. NPDC049141]|uniref:nucleotidyltransferase domain-containing protein n=1 Tax=Nonomuraea sp. NPDC049141 TaxID=3155500 RepID=UPI0033DA414F